MNENKKRKIILIIEDDSDIREMLQNFLRIHKFDSEAVSTGQGAIKKFETKEYDLYIIDYALPDINGFEVYKKLRTIYPSAPVLFYTAFTEHVSLNKCEVKDPFLHVFSKTSSPQALIRGIEILLTNGVAGDENK